MARKPRFRLGPGIYHVINRGINDAWILATPEERGDLLKLLVRLRQDRRIRIYHWVIMSNHFHLAVEAHDIHDLSLYVGKVCSLYSLAWHKRKGGHGPIWQARYRSILVQKQGYLERLGRYIERNPLAVENPEPLARPEEYSWSSAAAYLLGAEDPLVVRDLHPHWTQWGENDTARVAYYRNLIHRGEAADAEVFGCSDGVIGDDDFKAQAKRMEGRMSDRREGKHRKVRRV